MGESGVDKTLAFLQSDEYNRLIAVIKEPNSTKKELDKLQKVFKKHYNTSAPEGYIAFLKRNSGFKCREFELYSCDMAVAINEKKSSNFFIGRDKEYSLAYDTLTGKYITLKSEADVPDYYLSETYDSFADLFRMLMKRWYDM